MDFKFKALNAVHGAIVFKRRVRVLSRLLSAEIKGGTSALDLGCGDGSIAKRSWHFSHSLNSAA